MLTRTGYCNVSVINFIACNSELVCSCAVFVSEPHSKFFHHTDRRQRKHFRRTVVRFETELKYYPLKVLTNYLTCNGIFPGNYCARC